jgi:hypothetical protein
MGGCLTILGSQTNATGHIYTSINCHASVQTCTVYIHIHALQSLAAKQMQLVIYMYTCMYIVNMYIRI